MLLCLGNDDPVVAGDSGTQPTVEEGVAAYYLKHT